MGSVPSDARFSSRGFDCSNSIPKPAETKFEQTSSSQEKKSSGKNIL